jgi:hypothetical protein
VAGLTQAAVTLMPRATPRLLVVLVLLALAAGVLFVLWPEPDQRAATMSPSRLAPESAPAPATVALPVPDETGVVETLNAEGGLADAAGAPITPEAAADIALFEHGTARVVRWWGLETPQSDDRAPCEVVVVDRADQPVGGVLVEVRSQRSLDAPELVEQWSTDAEGRCTVQPHGSQPRVRASLAGVGCSGWEKVLHMEDPGTRAWRDQPRLVVLPLSPVRPAHGVVLRADGAPASGARVVIGNEPDAHAPPELLADADGRFALDVHAGERGWLRAEWGSAVSSPVRARVAPGETLVLQLREPVRVAGRVVTADGLPAAGVEVVFVKERTRAQRKAEIAARHDSQGVLPALERSWPPVSDAGGRFVLEVEAPDRGWVHTRAPALIETAVRLAVQPGELPPELELRLCAPSAIRGRLLDERGVAVPGAAVFAHAEWPEQGPSAESAGVMASSIYGTRRTLSGPDGSFALEQLHARIRYTLVAADVQTPRGWQLERAGVPGDATGVVLKLPAEARRTGIVHGQVRSTADGEPLHGVFMCALVGSEDGARVEQFPGDGHVGGRFRFESLPAGARCDLLISPHRRAAVVLRDVIATADAAELDVLAPAPGSVECRVTGPDGPVPWALVLADDADLPIPLRAYCEWRHVARTDAAGVVRLDDLRPGRWTLEVRSGGRTTHGDVIVPEGDVATVTIELR